MVEYEKENTISLGNIQNIANNFKSKKADYDKYQNFFTSISEKILLISSIVFVFSPFMMMIEAVTTKTINHTTYITPFSFLVAFSFFFLYSHFERIPFIKNKIEEKKLIMQKIVDTGISEQEQFNYLLFIDVLIKKCSANKMFDNEKNQIIELKKDMLSLCSEQDQEGLLKFISNNTNDLIDIYTKVSKFKTITNVSENFEKRYNKFVEKSNVLDDSFYLKQKIKNSL